MKGIHNTPEEMVDEWVLRMQCDSFIMVVNKNTGTYLNLYAHYFNDRDTLKKIASVLELHDKLKD